MKKLKGLSKGAWHNQRNRNREATQIIPRITEPAEVTHFCEDQHQILAPHYEYHKGGYYTKKDKDRKMTTAELNAITSLNKIRGTILK
jgi:hypothetical protein